MVRHQAERADSHRPNPNRFLNYPLERQEIALLVEQILPPHPAVENVK